MSQQIGSPIEIPTFPFDYLTAGIFGLFSLWGIIKAFKEAQKNKTKFDKSVIFAYAFIAVFPFFAMALISLFPYKLLILSILRLLIYGSSLLVFLRKKHYPILLSEVSKDSFAYSGGFALLMLVMVIFAGYGFAEAIFRVLDHFL